VSERAGLSFVDGGWRRPRSVAIRRTRLFTEFLAENARYGWVSVCEREFGAGVHPLAIVPEWNSIAHLQSYEGNLRCR
jgi:hypothetical protein